MAHYNVQLRGGKLAGKTTAAGPLARLRRWRTSRALRHWGVSATEAGPWSVSVNLKASKERVSASGYELHAYPALLEGIRLGVNRKFRSVAAWVLVLLLGGFSFLGMLARPALASNDTVRNTGPREAPGWNALSITPMLPTDCPPALAITDCGFYGGDGTAVANLKGLLTESRPLLAQGHVNHSNVQGGNHVNAPKHVNTAAEEAVTSHTNTPWANVTPLNPHTNVVPGEYIY